MARLEIAALGPPDIRLHGQSATGLASDKVRALLFYLAVESGRGPPERAHRRESLAGLLWPGYPERSARTNLSNALSNLRTALNEREVAHPCLRATRQAIGFQPRENVFVDVLAFEEAVAGERWEEAAALYRGPFLEGFSLGDSPEFEGWALTERERLQRAAIEALGRLAADHEAQGDLPQAIEAVRRQLELAPWDESAHRALMRLLALDGQRGAALAQYEACRQALAGELGVEPASEDVNRVGDPGGAKEPRARGKAVHRRGHGRGAGHLWRRRTTGHRTGAGPRPARGRRRRAGHDPGGRERLPAGTFAL